MLLNNYDDERSDELDPTMESFGKSADDVAWHEGVIKEPLKGVIQGSTRTLKTIGIVGAEVASILTDKAYLEHKLAGTPYDYTQKDWYFKQLDDVTEPALDYYQADIENSSGLAQGLGKFSTLITEVMLSRASGAAATEYANNKLGYIDTGYDNDTANKMAALDFVTTYVGVKAPAAIGKTLWQKAISGGIVGTVMGEADANTRKSLLEAHGYKADEIKRIDVERGAINFMMGAGFGAFAHYAPKQMGAIENKKQARDYVGEFFDLDKQSVELIRNIFSTQFTIPEKMALLNSHIRSSLNANDITVNGELITNRQKAVEYEQTGEIPALDKQLEADILDAVELPEQIAKHADIAMRDLTENMDDLASTNDVDYSLLDDADLQLDIIPEQALNIKTLETEPAENVRPAEDGVQPKAKPEPFADPETMAVVDRSVVKLQEIGDIEGAAELQKTLAEVQEDSSVMGSLITCLLGR